jgi:hypothetical protein
MIGSSAGFVPLEDFARVDAYLMIGVGNTGTVGHQSACRSEFAQALDRGNPMSGDQSDEALHLPSEKRIACDEECADLLLSKCRKGPVEIILAGNVQNGSRQP